MPSRNTAGSSQRGTPSNQFEPISSGTVRAAISGARPMSTSRHCQGTSRKYERRRRWAGASAAPGDSSSTVSRDSAGCSAMMDAPPPDQPYQRRKRCQGADQLSVSKCVLSGSALRSAGHTLACLKALAGAPAGETTKRSTRSPAISLPLYLRQLEQSDRNPFNVEYDCHLVAVRKLLLGNDDLAAELGGLCHAPSKSNRTCSESRSMAAWPNSARLAVVSPDLSIQC